MSQEGERNSDQQFVSLLFRVLLKEKETKVTKNDDVASGMVFCPSFEHSYTEKRTRNADICKGTSIINFTVKSPTIAAAQ